MFEGRRSTVLAFALPVVFWGSTFPAIKVGLGYSPPVLFAGIRTLLTGAAMMLVGREGEFAARLAGLPLADGV